MDYFDFDINTREFKQLNLQVDFAVCGGGLAGVCAAITAAREGIKVVLIQDRPVLGGNASSEVRLWALGATSHMGNNNRWAREGGVIDEILVENLYRNKEGNPVIFDTVLLDFIYIEKNITLLLNTCIYETLKSTSDRIESVMAFCCQNSTIYKISAAYFCDATGDGIVGFQAGAAFRIGAETKNEFNELFAPDAEDYGELLGHTIYFYSKKTDHPVKYVAPSFALKDISSIPRYREIKAHDRGTFFWWLEYGGRLDTIHETEEIKLELWRIVYGIWNYIKNSGQFPEAENMTLEWVGTIPGKRESRRFEGFYMLNQLDIIDQSIHDDAVAFGGWSIDLHPSDGVYGDKPSCTQWHSKGVYDIPYRCFVSKNITNLFLAGRIISASHVAFGSTRTMLTSSHAAQAVGMASVICKEKNVDPKELISDNYMKQLRTRLNLTGQSIIGLPIEQNMLLKNADITASSELELAEIPFTGAWFNLDLTVAQLLPFEEGTCYSFSFLLNAKKDTEIESQLRISTKKANYTPDRTLETIKKSLKKGVQMVEFSFTTPIPETQYGFITLVKNEKVSVQQSDKRCTGILSVFQKENLAVSNTGRQTPPENIGIESFDFLTPQRRPKGHNLAMKISPGIKSFQAANVKNGFLRPYLQSNAWVAKLTDKNPFITLTWDVPQTVSEIKLFFDTDLDHPMESAQLGHPESVIPFVVRDYSVYDDQGNLLFEKIGNYQTVNKIQLNKVVTKKIEIKLSNPEGDVPVSLFQVIVK